LTALKEKRQDAYATQNRLFSDLKSSRYDTGSYSLVAPWDKENTTGAGAWQLKNDKTGEISGRYSSHEQAMDAQERQVCTGDEPNV
jgi:hypothetical protein